MPVSRWSRRLGEQEMKALENRDFCVAVVNQNRPNCVKKQGSLSLAGFLARWLLPADRKDS